MQLAMTGPKPMSLPPIVSSTVLMRARRATSSSSVSCPGMRTPRTGTVYPSSMPGLYWPRTKPLVVLAPEQARLMPTVPGTWIAEPRARWQPGMDSPLGVSQ